MWLVLLSLGLAFNVVAAEPEMVEEEDEEEIFPKMHLRLGHTAAPTHVLHKADLLFAREVAQRTNNRVQIDVYPSFELGDQDSLVEQVSMGSVDMCHVTQSNTTSYVPRMYAMTLPFIFRDYAHSHRVIDNFLEKWENEGYEQVNIHLLAIYDYGFRYLTTHDREVHSAADVKGLRLRVPNYRGVKVMFDSLGAETKTINYFSLYQSLSNGTVEAQENPFDTILADGLFLLQNRIALTYHHLDTQDLIINADLFYSFDPRLQRIFYESAKKAQALTRELIAEKDEETLYELKKKGMAVNDVDRKS
ncbi:MAG: TRAP transporter substrate-binding protein, partial [Succinivibrio sp.]|nr:TRAP transporter substrate-binding protein [Succinivibrio sp.]